MPDDPLQPPPAHIKLDEHNHVEKPLLDRLACPGRHIIKLNSNQLILFIDTEITRL
jgi:hypothetical protein